MNQYLTEVMDRLSVGGLIALLVLLVVCIIISIIRSNRAKPAPAVNEEAMVCPMCKQEVSV